MRTVHARVYFVAFIRGPDRYRREIPDWLVYTAPNRRCVKLALFTGSGVDFTPMRSASFGPRASAGKVNAGPMTIAGMPRGAWSPD